MGLDGPLGLGAAGIVMPVDAMVGHLLHLIAVLQHHRVVVTTTVVGVVTTQRDAKSRQAIIAPHLLHLAADAGPDADPGITAVLHGQANQHTAPWLSTS